MSKLQELQRDIEDIQERIADLINGDLSEIGDTQWTALTNIQYALNVVNGSIIQLTLEEGNHV